MNWFKRKKKVTQSKEFDNDVLKSMKEWDDNNGIVKTPHDTILLVANKIIECYEAHNKQITLKELLLQSYFVYGSVLVLEHKSILNETVKFEFAIPCILTVYWSFNAIRPIKKCNVVNDYLDQKIIGIINFAYEHHSNNITTLFDSGIKAIMMERTKAFRNMNGFIDDNLVALFENHDKEIIMSNRTIKNFVNDNYEWMFKKEIDKQYSQLKDGILSDRNGVMYSEVTQSITESYFQLYYRI